MPNMSRTLPMIRSRSSAAICSRLGPSLPSIGSTPSAAARSETSGWNGPPNNQPASSAPTGSTPISSKHGSVPRRSSTTTRSGLVGISEVPSSCSTVRKSATASVVGVVSLAAASVVESTDPAVAVVSLATASVVAGTSVVSALAAEPVVSDDESESSDTQPAPMSRAAATRPPKTHHLTDFTQIPNKADAEHLGGAARSESKRRRSRVSACAACARFARGRASRSTRSDPIRHRR